MSASYLIRNVSLFAALGIAAFAMPAHAATPGIVTAGYITNADPNLDHIQMTISNLSSSALSDVTLTENLPANPNVLGSVPVIDSVMVGTINAGNSATSDTNFFFPNDFGNNPATFYTSPFDVTVTALENGALFSTTFNQDQNASGKFVGFEGIGENGNPPYQPVPPTVVGKLAAVPEPKSLVALALGAGGLLFLGFRRRVSG